MHRNEGKQNLSQIEHENKLYIKFIQSYIDYNNEECLRLKNFTTNEAT